MESLEEFMSFIQYTYRESFYVRLNLYLIVLTVILKMFFKYLSKRKRLSYPKDTVILHQFPQAFSYKEPSMSPYCLKLETWLRMAKIPYQNERGFKFSSKGKIPWITYNGTDTADSQFCIEHLAEILNADLNKKITNNVEKAAARAFFKLAEESVYPCIALSRFVYYPDVKRSGLPHIVLKLFKSKIKKWSIIQGYGRHTKNEVFEIAKKDLKAINDYIGSRTYLTGDNVCNEDAALFGILSQMVYQDCGFLTEYIQNECPNIVRYTNTIRDNFWPDWSENIRNTPIGFFEFIRCLF